jgi:DNA-binding beta-propeller fold protein YncE
VLLEWNRGDLFAGVGNGTYNMYDSSGSLKETIFNGFEDDQSLGCAFNNDGSKLYATAFDIAKVVVLDAKHPHTVLQTIDTSPGGGPESIVFDAAGSFYVSSPDGDKMIRKFDAAGTLLATYSAATEERGTDWIDLAKDQCTLYYTSEGPSVKRFDVCTNKQLSDFATGLVQAYALRLLPLEMARAVSWLLTR